MSVGVAGARPASARSFGNIARRFSAERWIMGCTTLLLLALVVYPIGQLFLGTLVDNQSGQLSLVNIQWVLATPRLLDSLRTTLLFATGTTLLATLAGVTLAWSTARANTPGREIFEVLNIVPLFTSSFVGAMAWRLLLNPNNGAVNVFLRQTLGLPIPPINIYTLGGMVFVMSLFTAPYAYMFTIGSFRKIDASLEEAARVSGANTLRTMRKITLPLATPAILSATLFIFILTCGVLEVPLAIGGPGRINTLSMEIIDRMTYPANLNQAATVASVVLAITLVGVYIQRRIILRRSYVTVTGKGSAPKVVNLGHWRWLTFALNLLYIVLALVLPLGILFLVSLSSVWAGSFNPANVTLQNYSHVLFEYDETARSIQNSLVLGVLSGLFGATLAVVLSYLVYRTRLPARGLVDFVAMVPIAVPGVALGIAILVAWISTPLYGTLWILLIAYVTRWLPTAQRNVSSVLLAISPELDECARVCGASWLTMMRRIIVPLLRPGIVAAFLLMFIISIRELSASLLLYKQGTEVMSVALWLAINRNAPTVAAFSMVQTFILLVATVLFFRTVGKTVQL